MGVLRNGLNLLGVSSFLQQIVIGSVIIVAVLLDMALKKQRRNSFMRNQLGIKLTRWPGALRRRAVLAGCQRIGRRSSGGPRVALVLKTLNNPFFIEMETRGQGGGRPSRA